MPIKMPIGTVLSDYNLGGFLAFINDNSTPESLRKCVLEWVYIIHHRSYDLIEPLPVGSIPVLQCADPTCSRCQEGRGGYKFPWISPLWTQQWWAKADVAVGIPGCGIPGFQITGPIWRRCIVSADGATRARGEEKVKGHVCDWQPGP